MATPFFEIRQWRTEGCVDEEAFLDYNDCAIDPFKEQAMDQKSLEERKAAALSVLSNEGFLPHDIEVFDVRGGEWDSRQGRFPQNYTPKGCGISESLGYEAVGSGYLREGETFDRYGRKWIVVMNDSGTERNTEGDSITGQVCRSVMIIRSVERTSPDMAPIPALDELEIGKTYDLRLTIQELYITELVQQYVGMRCCQFKMDKYAHDVDYHASFRKTLAQSAAALALETWHMFCTMHGGEIPPIWVPGAQLTEIFPVILTASFKPEDSLARTKRALVQHRDQRLVPASSITAEYALRFLWRLGLAVFVRDVKLGFNRKIHGFESKQEALEKRLIEAFGAL